MSGVTKGSLGLCGVNNDILPTSLANDFLMYVTRSNQRILFGTSNSKTSMIINGTGDIDVTSKINTDVISVNSALGRFYGKADTESAPSYTWNADSNTGMFNQSNSVIAFALNGSQHFKLQPGLLSTSNANLSLHGDTRFITLETNNNTSSSSTAGITLKNNWKRERGIYFQNIDTSFSNSIWHLGSKYTGGSANSNLGFYYSSNIIQEFGPTGNVGIGKAPSTYKLDINGNIACNGITLFQAIG